MFFYGEKLLLHYYHDNPSVFISEQQNQKDQERGEDYSSDDQKGAYNEITK